MKKILLSLLFVLLFLGFSFADWQDIEGFKIRKISVEGISKAAENMIREVLTIKEGDEVNSDKIIQTTKNIDSLGVFYDFKIEYEIVDSSKKIVHIYIVGNESSILDD